MSDPAPTSDLIRELRRMDSHSFTSTVSVRAVYRSAADELECLASALCAAEVARDTAWAEVDGLRADLAAARAVTRRLLDGWSYDDTGWHRPVPDPPVDWRRLGDVPRGWVFKLNADDPQWRLLNTEATFMWDLEAQVLCRPQATGGWKPMSDAERAWLASVAATPTGGDDE